MTRFHIAVACWLITLAAMLALTQLRVYTKECVCTMNGLFEFLKLIHRKKTYKLLFIYVRISKHYFYLAGKYMPNLVPNRSKFNVIFEIFLFLMGGAGVISYKLATLLLMRDPRRLPFVGSLIPTEYYTKSTKFAIVIYQSYVLLVTHVALFMLATATVIYAFYVAPFYLLELKLGRLKYKTDNRLRNYANIQIMFRALQILHDQAMSLFGPLLLVSNGYVMYTVIFSSSVLIRYWPTLSLLARSFLGGLCVLFLCFWVFVLEMGRFFCTNGTKTLGSWRKASWGSNKKEMVRFCRSCKPILICYESQFVVRRLTMLKFLQGVIRGTLRSLLLLSKS